MKTRRHQKLLLHVADELFFLHAVGDDAIVFPRASDKPQSVAVIKDLSTQGIKESNLYF